MLLPRWEDGFALPASPVTTGILNDYRWKGPWARLTLVLFLPMLHPHPSQGLSLCRGARGISSAGDAQSTALSRLVRGCRSNLVGGL